MTGHFSRLSSPDLPQALCIGKDPEMFYAEDCINPDMETVEKARAICAPCPEQKKCLVWGLQNENFGMWGGLTANERRYLRRRKFYKLQHIKELGLY